MIKQIWFEEDVSGLRADHEISRIGGAVSRMKRDHMASALELDVPAYEDELRRIVEEIILELQSAVVNRTTKPPSPGSA
jgi:hypothetical protein